MVKRYRVIEGALVEVGGTKDENVPVYGTYVGDGVMEGQTVLLEFTPSIVFVMISGTDFYSALNTYMSHVSGHFALAFRDLPYVSYDGAGGIEIIEGGFIARSGYIDGAATNKSHFNSTGKLVRYIAYR